MIYINNAQYPNMTAYTMPAMIGNSAETVLIVIQPQTDHAPLYELYNGAEIMDEQERTIHRYTSLICYSVADADGKTYAKVRLREHTQADNPAYDRAQHLLSQRQLTDADLAMAAAQQQVTDLTLRLEGLQ